MKELNMAMWAVGMVLQSRTSLVIICADTDVEKHIRPNKAGIGNCTTNHVHGSSVDWLKKKANHSFLSVICKPEVIFS